MRIASEMKNTSNWDYTFCVTVASLEMSDEPFLFPYCRFLYFREWLEIMLLHKVLWPSAQGYGSKYNPNGVEILSHTIGLPWVDMGTTVTFAT